MFFNTTQLRRHAIVVQRFRTVEYRARCEPTKAQRMYILVQAEDGCDGAEIVRREAGPLTL